MKLPNIFKKDKNKEEDNNTLDREDEKVNVKGAGQIFKLQKQLDDKILDENKIDKQIKNLQDTIEGKTKLVASYNSQIESSKGELKILNEKHIIVHNHKLELDFEIKKYQDGTHNALLHKQDLNKINIYELIETNEKLEENEIAYKNEIARLNKRLKSGVITKSDIKDIKPKKQETGNVLKKQKSQSDIDDMLKQAADNIKQGTSKIKTPVNKKIAVKKKVPVKKIIKKPTTKKKPTKKLSKKK